MSARSQTFCQRCSRERALARRWHCIRNSRHRLGSNAGDKELAQATSLIRASPLGPDSVGALGRRTKAAKGITIMTPQEITAVTIIVQNCATQLNTLAQDTNAREQRIVARNAIELTIEMLGGLLEHLPVEVPPAKPKRRSKPRS
jgi:hypothetical protein